MKILRNILFAAFPLHASILPSLIHIFNLHAMFVCLFSIPKSGQDMEKRELHQILKRFFYFVNFNSSFLSLCKTINILSRSGVRILPFEKHLKIIEFNPRMHKIYHQMSSGGLMRAQKIYH